jgi:hypothetical protein
MKKLIYGLLAFVILATALPVMADQEFSQRVWFRNKAIFSKDVTFGGDITTSGALTLNGVQYTFPAADGTSGYQLTTDGSGTLSWAATGTTAWDDISNPDNNKALDFTDYYTSMDFGDTDHDMLTIQGTGAFGDVSVVKIEQAAGDPTNGTVLEVVSADTDADALLVTANSVNVIQVLGAGTLALTGTTAISGNVDIGNYYMEIGTDPADAGTIRLANAASIQFEADGAGTDINALSVDSSEIVQIGSAGASGVTVTPDTTFTGDISAVDGTFSGNVSCADLTATGAVNIGTLKLDALVPVTAPNHTITIDGAGSGGVTIGNTSTGNVTIGDDLVVADTYNALIGEGKLTIDDDANETALVITSDVTDGTSASITSTVTSGKVLSLIGDSLTDGALLYLDATEGGTFTGYYILAYDGTANDFAVKRHGEVEITGAAGDMLTITTGNIELTAGDIDVNDGVIEINTDEDEDCYITRAYAGAGSAPAFTVTDSNASTTQPAMTIAAGGNATTGALTINQTGTGNAVGIDLNVAGDYPAIDIDASAARDGDAIDIAMANMLDERALNITGAITAAAGEGTIEIHSTGQVAATGSLLRLDNDTAQAADGSSGYILNIDDDTLVATTPVVYAALIDSNANGALHVSKGVSLFADAVTFTAASVHNGGLTIAEDIDINFDNADEEINLTNTAEMDNDLAQVTIANTDADLTDGDLTANMYLLRLVYTDDGDPDGAFVVCEDAAGTDKLIIDAEGELTTEGDINVNGNIIGDGATEMVGVRHDVVDGGAGGTVTVTAAMSGTVFTNSQAVEFDLPADPTGLEFTFVVANASNLHIDPNDTDQIIHSTCGAGDRILSATVGDTVTLVGISSSAWYVKSMYPANTDWTDAD